MEKMLNLVLFGPPGAGKGTQSENLINKYGLVHLSTGDLFRKEIARGTDLGKKAKDIMDKGELVGDDIVIGMIESKLDENPNVKGFIFDGFPRTSSQAISLDDLLQKKGTGISAMLALEVDDKELIKRLLLRGQHSGRPDDKNEDVIRNRIVEYNSKTLPLKKYYNEQGKFHSIDGIGSVDQIFKDLVDRIIFLKAEMDLTALESDLEHLDLTIQDFEVANEIAPELLLEIDAIKRAEAEEAQEERAFKKQIKKATSNKHIQKPNLKPVTKKQIAKKITSKIISAKKKVLKKATKKTPAKKITPKKVAIKKPIIKKNKLKKTIKKTVKKILLKAKLSLKKAVKKAKPVKTAKKTKAVFKTKKAALKPTKKVIKKSK
jgi:adenylate kinase